MATYVDLNDIQDPATDEDILSAWGDQVRENDEFLYGRKPGCKSTKTQDIDTVTETAIDFGSGSVGYDTTPTMFDGTKLVLPVSGLWTFTAWTTWAVSPDGERQGKWKVNGLDGYLTTVQLAPTPSGQSAYTHTEPDRFYVAGDYIEYLVDHSIGSTQSVTVRVSCRWLSP